MTSTTPRRACNLSVCADFCDNHTCVGFIASTLRIHALSSLHQQLISRTRLRQLIKLNTFLHCVWWYSHDVMSSCMIRIILINCGPACDLQNSWPRPLRIPRSHGMIPHQCGMTLRDEVHEFFYIWLHIMDSHCVSNISMFWSVRIGLPNDAPPPMLPLPLILVPCRKIDTNKCQEMYSCIVSWQYNMSLMFSVVTNIDLAILEVITNCPWHS